MRLYFGPPSLAQTSRTLACVFFLVLNASVQPAVCFFLGCRPLASTQHQQRIIIYGGNFRPSSSSLVNNNNQQTCFHPIHFPLPQQPTRLLAKSKDIENSSSSTTTNTNTTITKIEGIGGKGGAVYDVNRLKRNLLQETMAAYKEELFELLSRSTPMDDAEVVEKLLALVQASPVRTTTDSNILDGATDSDWFLAYRSQYPTTVASLVIYEGDYASMSSGSLYNARYNFLFQNANTKEESGGSSGSGSSSSSLRKKPRGKVVWNKVKDFCQAKKRSFRLEYLADDEDAYIMDTTFILGGVLTKTKRFALEGLTRSSLRLHPESTRWSVLMGRSPPKHTAAVASAPSSSSSAQDNSSDNNKSKQGDTSKSFSVQIIYLDNDLCILTEEDGPDSPFMVYTRNKAYLGIYKSTQRKFKILNMAVWGLLTMPIRGLFRKIGSRRGWRDTASSANDPIVKVILQDSKSSSSTSGGTATKLRVLRLGDANGDDEDESWESESDPFVHLSADERQRLLKAMSVEEVAQAADTYRNSQMRFRFIRKLFGRRKTYFKKPPEKWRRPR